MILQVGPFRQQDFAAALRRPLEEFHHPDVPVPNAPRAMRPRQNDTPKLKARRCKVGPYQL